MIGVFIFLQKIFDVKNINDTLLLLNTVSRSWAFGGTAQAVPEFNNVFDIIVFLPIGMFTALFRPMPWEAHNLFTILASIENLILIFLFLKGLRNFDMHFVRYPFIAFAGLLLAAWALVYAFISYQNLGTALRFKSDILPFFLLIFVPLAFPKEKLKLTRAMEISS
jgi:hypothetical protein